MKKTSYKFIFTVICILFSAGIILFAENNPNWVEVNYSQSLYLKISAVLNCIFGYLPFSVYETLIVLAVFLILAGAVFTVKNFSLKSFINFLSSIGVFVSSLVLIFIVFWGINNYRMPLEHALPFKAENSSANQLKDACIYFIEKANETREFLPETNIGIPKIPDGYKYIFENSEKVYKNIYDIYPIIPDTGHIKPKAMIFSEVMSRLNYTGVYSMFTGEANINIKEPIFQLPFTVCHEIAHKKGFSKENEANFIAFLVCINSDDPYFIYSGYLSALIHSTNTLYKVSEIDYRDVAGLYSDKIRRDLNYVNNFWNQYRGTASKIGDLGNDTFLKMTNQPAGTKSYGLVADLLIAYYKYEIDDL